jgi:hypothetical protein
LPITKAGPRPVRVTYQDSVRYNAKTIMITVHPAKGNVNITASANPSPSAVNTLVTFTWNVSSIASGVAVTPTGRVTVTSGGQSCANDLPNNMCSFAFLNGGNNQQVTISYAGDVNFNPGSITISHNVIPCPYFEHASTGAPDQRYWVTGKSGNANTFRFHLVLKIPTGFPISNTNPLMIQGVELTFPLDVAPTTDYPVKGVHVLSSPTTNLHCDNNGVWCNEVSNVYQYLLLKEADCPIVDNPRGGCFIFSGRKNVETRTLTSNADTVLLFDFVGGFNEPKNFNAYRVNLNTNYDNICPIKNYQ